MITPLIAMLRKKEHFPEFNFGELTWTCHACDKERLDKDISVLTFPLEDLPGAEINIRYCNDNPTCEERARKAGEKGEFPHESL